MVNTSAAQGYVAEIERQIRTAKERRCAIVSTLLFEILPKLIVINILYFFVLWLNAFPVRNGISKKYSPQSIVICNKLSWKRHCNVPFGTYCEVHDGPINLSNNITPRFHEGIVVGPTRNVHGTYKFLFVDNGLIIKRQSFTKFNMPDSVIEKVNAYGSKTKRGVYGRDLEFSN